MSSAEGVQRINRQNQERAVALMYEALQTALTQIERGVKIRTVTIRVPFHGNQIGTPTKSTEME